MERHIKIIFSALALCIFLGCVNFMSMGSKPDKDIALSDLDKIKPGMTEQEVIALFGRPSSFGVDEKGKEYLHYEVAKFSRTEGALAVPFVGAMSTSSSIKGFIFNVYLKDGLVQGKSQYLIQVDDDKKEKSKQ